MPPSPVLNGIVLAAGRATRLRPLSDIVPKALLPVATVPAIDFALAGLNRACVRRLGVNIHHLPDQLAGHLQRLEWTARTEIITSHEPELLGTAGGIRRLVSELGGDRFVVHNADILADIDLEAMVALHDRTGATATLAVTRQPPGRPTIRLGAPDRVVDIIQTLGLGQPDADYLGVCVLEASFVEGFPAQGCLVRDGLIPLLREGGRVGAWIHDGYACDLGTPERLLAAQAELLSGRMRLSGRPAEAVRQSRGRSRRIFPQVELVEPVALGEGVEIDTGTRLGPNVAIGHGTRIGRGCRLEEALVLDGASVAAGTRLARVIVSPREVLRVPMGGVTGS